MKTTNNAPASRIFTRFTLLLCVAGLVLISFASQSNYELAVLEARMSDGSDVGIEMAMSAHGFDVDACDPAEPSFSDKCAAYISIMF